MKEKKFIFLLLYMLYSSNGGGMSGQKNDAAGSVGFFRRPYVIYSFPPGG